MKIGIDARMYGSQNSGLGRYVEQLVLGLQEIDEENEYVLFVSTNTPPIRPELMTKANPPFLRGELRFKIVIADIPWYSWQEQIKFKKIIDQEKIELMHFPHWNVPLFYNKPFVVTVHDLIMYHYPRPEATTLGPIKFWFKDKVHRIVLRQAVKKAKQIIVTSEFTKQDLHKTLNVPLNKMSVIYQSPSFVNEQKLGNLETKKLEKYEINKKFVLYVGNAYPHKNLDGLLKAWKIFVEKYGSDYQLVLVGKENFFYNKLITSLKQDDNDTIEQWHNVIFTGYVNDNELSALYQNASLYVFPSLYEGFGLPPLEAQSYGVPVVSSNSTCLPEILGESALYFDPENYQQMAEIIYQGLTDKNIRFELQEKAKEELKRYSLVKMIQQTIGVYKSTSL